MYMYIYIYIGGRPIRKLQLRIEVNGLSESLTRVPLSVTYKFHIIDGQRATATARASVNSARANSEG